MPAYTRREPALLLVTFESDGEEPEQALAPTGARALKTALLCSQSSTNCAMATP
jgi:hypothetical protein